MLLRVLFLAFAIALLGETLLHAAAALALAAFHRQGIAAAQTAFANAAQLAQSSIASAVASGATPPVMMPSPAPTCAERSGDTCLMTSSVTLTPATPAPSPCPSTGCGTYLQGEDAIGEGRLAVAIDAVVTNAAGERIAARDGNVVFRTLRIPPYAIPVGALDATLDDLAGSAGDEGGLVSAGSGAGTLIDVVYRNASSGATMPANVWTGLAPPAPLARPWTP
ncbi:MAG TPA: hypothetical protein VIN40_05945 [Candidatus Tyrphobacter sp.]